MITDTRPGYFHVRYQLVFIQKGAPEHIMFSCEKHKARSTSSQVRCEVDKQTVRKDLFTSTKQYFVNCFQMNLAIADSGSRLNSEHSDVFFFLNRPIDTRSVLGFIQYK